MGMGKVMRERLGWHSLLRAGIWHSFGHHQQKQQKQQRAHILPKAAWGLHPPPLPVPASFSLWCLHIPPPACPYWGMIPSPSGVSPTSQQPELLHHQPG